MLPEDRSLSRAGSYPGRPNSTGNPRVRGQNRRRAPSPRIVGAERDQTAARTRTEAGLGVEKPRLYASSSRAVHNIHAPGGSLVSSVSGSASLKMLNATDAPGASSPRSQASAPATSPGPDGTPIG